MTNIQRLIDKSVIFLFACFHLGVIPTSVQGLFLTIPHYQEAGKENCFQRHGTQGTMRCQAVNEASCMQTRTSVFWAISPAQGVQFFLLHFLVPLILFTFLNHF